MKLNIYRNATSRKASRSSSRKTDEGAMARLFRLLLILQPYSFESHGLAIMNDCRANQHLDPQRLVCLDRCGRDNELTCPVEDFCSSNQPWSQHFDPPFCLNRCIRACDAPSYCDHSSADCRPCHTLCDGSDMSACRAYCYDMYIVLPPTTPQPPWESCYVNQYYDHDRKLCLDRCGENNEQNCTVDQFCSTINMLVDGQGPSACLNICNERCNGASYCDHISHTCVPCNNICDGSKKNLCRIHCNASDLRMDETTSGPEDVAGLVTIATHNTIDVLKESTGSYTIYPLVGALMISIGLAISGVADAVIANKRRRRKTPSTPKLNKENGTIEQHKYIPLNGYHKSHITV